IVTLSGLPIVGLTSVERNQHLRVAYSVNLGRGVDHTIGRLGELRVFRDSDGPWTGCFVHAKAQSCRPRLDVRSPAFRADDERHGSLTDAHSVPRLFYRVLRV